jgi:hypothetical protein
MLGLIEGLNEVEGDTLGEILGLLEGLILVERLGLKEGLIDSEGTTASTKVISVPLSAKTNV